MIDTFRRTPAGGYGSLGFTGTTSRGAQPPHPDRRLLVFCVRLPCAACSRMLFFSSSRWPLVVSRGTSGALPGPLWLWLSSGIGGTVFVIRVSVTNGKSQRQPRRNRSQEPRHGLAGGQVSQP